MALLFFLFLEKGGGFFFWRRGLGGERRIFFFWGGGGRGEGRINKHKCLNIVGGFMSGQASGEPLLRLFLAGWG